MTSVALRALQLRKAWFAATHRSVWAAARRGVFPAIEHTRLLSLLQPGTVIDVGAHTGQFALAVTSVCPGATLVSFEPQPDAALVYRSVVPRPAELMQLALGAADATVSMHVSRASDSSSLLRPSGAQLQHFPGTEEVSTIEVPVRTLDDSLAGRQFPGPVLLKIDVQGTEGDVLRGGRAFLALVTWVYVELSMVELYESQELAPAIIELLRAHGFLLSGVHNVQVSSSGQALQADFLFSRSSAPHGQEPPA